MSRIALLLTILVVLSAGCSTAGPATVVLLDSGAYASADAARTDWESVGGEAPAVALARRAGRTGLKLIGDFTAPDDWRFAWQRSGTWNLADCRRIELTASPSDEPVRMMLSLRSGQGWYWIQFDAPPGWHTLSLPRVRFHTDGRPAGWHNISAVRLGLLRPDTPPWGPIDVLVGRLGAIEQPARIAVYVNVAGVSKADDIGASMRIVADALERQGIGHEILDDDAIAAGQLARKTVAILPNNPVLGPGPTDALTRFVADGGKLIVCHRLPEPLGRMLGVTAGDDLDGADGRLDSIVSRNAAGQPASPVTQQSITAVTIIPREGTHVRGHWQDRRG